MNELIIAKINLLGMLFDSLGGLYLAYDILGGEKGPLKLITRFITYSILLFILYDLCFGFKFAIVAGFGLGAILSLQFYLFNHYRDLSKKVLLILTLCTTSVMGIAMIVRFGREFGLWFMLFNSTIACIINTYYISLKDIYLKIFDNKQKSKFEIINFYPALTRGLVIGFSSSMASLMTFHKIEALTIGLIIGLIASIIGTVVTIAVPFIERFVDDLPDKTLGYFGIILFIIGFMLQSLQYIEVLWKITETKSIM